MSLPGNCALVDALISLFLSLSTSHNLLSWLVSFLLLTPLQEFVRAAAKDDKSLRPATNFEEFYG
jgi:hypothetical protein